MVVMVVVRRLVLSCKGLGGGVGGIRKFGVEM